MRLQKKTLNLSTRTPNMASADKFTKKKKKEEMQQHYEVNQTIFITIKNSKNTII